MTEKKAPINVTKEAEQNPLLFLVEILAAPESQKTRMMQSFLDSETLPTDIQCDKNYNAKAILEAAGVKFLGPVPDNKLFQYVELPLGWKRIKTDYHNSFSIVDANGHLRAKEFYKAAFNDSQASMRLQGRYDYCVDETDDKTVFTAITDKMKGVIHTIPGAQDLTATKWLNANYPDWRNPGAYWND